MTSPISSVSATPTPAAAGGGDGGLRKAAEAFEAVILRQLMASMRQFGIADMVEQQFRGQLGGLAARAGGGVQ